MPVVWRWSPLGDSTAVLGEPAQQRRYLNAVGVSRARERHITLTEIEFLRAQTCESAGRNSSCRERRGNQCNSRTLLRRVHDGCHGIKLNHMFWAQRPKTKHGRPLRPQIGTMVVNQQRLAYPVRCGAVVWSFSQVWCAHRHVALGKQLRAM